MRGHVCVIAHCEEYKSCFFVLFVVVFVLRSADDNDDDDNDDSDDDDEISYAVNQKHISHTL